MERRQWQASHYTFEVKDVLYFPDSPVNILSVTKFADQLDDYHGTGCDTKPNCFVLYWNNKRFQRMIKHPASNLPELIVNEGWSIFHIFSKVVGTKVYLGKQFCHCHASHLIPDDSVELSQPRTHLQLNKEDHTVYVKIESIDLDSG